MTDPNELGMQIEAAVDLHKNEREQELSAEAIAAIQADEFEKLSNEELFGEEEWSRKRLDEIEDELDAFEDELENTDDVALFGAETLAAMRAERIEEVRRLCAETSRKERMP